MPIATARLIRTARSANWDLLCATKAERTNFEHFYNFFSIRPWFIGLCDCEKAQRLLYVFVWASPQTQFYACRWQSREIHVKLNFELNEP